VHVNPAARSYAITRGSSQLAPIHSARLPEPGAKLKVPLRLLANQTYRELDGRVKLGRAENVRFAGNVTFTGTVPGESRDDPAVRVYTVSSRGVSVLVRMPEDPDLKPPAPGDSVIVDAELVPAPGAPAAPAPAERGRQSPSSGGAAPKRGATAAAAGVCATPSGPQPDPGVESEVVLRQTKLERAEGISLKHSDLEGVVQGCVDEDTLVISADDVRESGQDLSLDVAPGSGIDLDQLRVGQSITATGERDEGEPFTRISGLSSDQGVDGANDPGTAQGDQA
jgi:hypothetical protein